MPALAMVSHDGHVFWPPIVKYVLLMLLRICCRLRITNDMGDSGNNHLLDYLKLNFTPFEVCHHLQDTNPCQMAVNFKRQLFL